MTASNVDIDLETGVPRRAHLVTRNDGDIVRRTEPRGNLRLAPLPGIDLGCQTESPGGLEHNDTSVDAGLGAVRPLPFTCNLQINNLARLQAQAKREPAPKSRAGEFIFLCLKDLGGSPFAIDVRCRRPIASHTELIEFSVESDEEVAPDFDGRATSEPERPRDLRPDELAVDCDGDILERVRNVAVSKNGFWSKYNPCYGVTKVEEVKFKVIGRRNEDGSCPIKMTPVDVEDINELEKTLKEQIHVFEKSAVLLKSQKVFRDGGETYCDENRHSEDCWQAMKHWNQDCSRDQADRAKARLQRLRNRHELTNYLLHPTHTNGYECLAGMAQESCVYSLPRNRTPNRHGPDDSAAEIKAWLDENRKAKMSPEFRGLYVEFGWYRGTFVGLLLASVVWFFSLIVAGRTGDWQTVCSIGAMAVATLQLMWAPFLH